MFVRAVFCAAALLFSAPGASSDRPLQPTGKWIVNFDDAQCVAERNYGTEEKPLYFVLKQPPLGNAMQFSVIEKKSASARPAELDGTIEFDGQSHKVRVLRFGPKKMKLRVLMMNFPLEQFSAVRTAGALRLRTQGFDETFALSQLEPLLEVMNTCVADLRKIWNVDKPEGGEGVAREDAKGNLRRLFSADDYPWQAVISGDGGTVEVALLVDETGKVADCSIARTSGVAVLDAQSCWVLRERAKFTPAVGKDGKPAKDSFLQRISWRVN
ncbi:MAG TPA: energy transducer TonB [Sphingomicrobium sp.]|nr:energy transducer TonB [Sphingomicrobium sp.]